MSDRFSGGPPRRYGWGAEYGDPFATDSLRDFVRPSSWQRQLIPMVRTEPLAYGESAVLKTAPQRAMRLDRLWVASECAHHHSIVSIVVRGDDMLLDEVPAEVFGVASTGLRFGAVLEAQAEILIEVRARKPLPPFVRWTRPLSWFRWLAYWCRPSSWELRKATHAPIFRAHLIGDVNA